MTRPLYVNTGYCKTFININTRGFIKGNSHFRLIFSYVNDQHGLPFAFAARPLSGRHPERCDTDFLSQCPLSQGVSRRDDELARQPSAG